jgi:nucleotide-binding universal stress UspA family protein
MSDESRAKEIVVGYDGSAGARDALAAGLALARATSAPLVLAGAYGPDSVLSPDELEARGIEVGEQLLRADQYLPSGLPFPVERIPVPGVSAAAALHKLAEEMHPRAVVLGSSHRGTVGRVLAGSVAERLLNGSPCPVVVAPRGLAEREEPAELRTVCVGFDARAEGWTALQRAAQIASASGAQLRVVMVLPPLTGTPTMPLYPAETVAERHRRAEIELDRAVRSVARRTEPGGRLLRGNPAQVLADQAGQDVDLLVVGSRGYGPLRRVLLGSVSTPLVRAAPCPVMVVPRTAEFQPIAEGMAAEDEFVSSG